MLPRYGFRATWTANRRVKSYGGVPREYEFHPEAKCADSTSAPCKKQSVGLLDRRHVMIDSITYIGKESNRSEEVGEQSVLDPNDVYTEYVDPRSDEWSTKVLTEVTTLSLRDLMRRTGLPRSTLQAIRGRPKTTKKAPRFAARYCTRY